MGCSMTMSYCSRRVPPHTMRLVVPGVLPSIRISRAVTTVGSATAGFVTETRVMSNSVATTVERPAVTTTRGNSGAAAGAWPAGDTNGERHQTWVCESWAKFKPFSTGGNYINFQTVDDDTARIESSYRANYRRLQQVKADYDPGNVFRVNRNLTPYG